MEARSKAKILRQFWQVADWLYGGDMDTEVLYRTAKVVRIRYSQVCCGGYHDGSVRKYQSGTFMVAERALVDGRWATCYTCEHCIKESIKELEIASCAVIHTNERTRR